MEEVILLRSDKEHETIYRTPAGDMSQDEYLVWIGNELIEIKKSMEVKK